MKHKNSKKLKKSRLAPPPSVETRVGIEDFDAEDDLPPEAYEDEEDAEDLCDCDDEAEEQSVTIPAVDSIRASQRITDYLERRLHLEGIIGSTSGSNGGRSNASKLAEDIIRFNWADDDYEAQWRQSHPGEPLPERTPIKIFINSAGGSLHDTMDLVDKILKSKTPVWTITEGLCASGGFYVFIAGDHRLCSSFTTFLVHEGMLSSDYGDKFDDMIRMAEHFAKFQRKKIQPFVRSRIKTEAGLIAYKKRLHSEWYIDANKAIRYGMADEIIDNLSILR